jgi:4a-hydroxytetrahydrobiopterin dehydratase
VTGPDRGAVFLSVAGAMMPGMGETAGGTATLLTRPEAAEALDPLGWRYILGVACTCVRVTSVRQAAEVAARVCEACGQDADGHLWMDVRADRVLLHLQSLAVSGVTSRDVELAGAISCALAATGLRTGPEVDGDGPRSVQLVEIGIDALNIPAIRPFWKAVMGYVDEPGASGPQGGLIDPLRQGPAIWFQQMDAPRPQRNRIHFDISVAHDEAQRRIRAALDAGAVLRYDAEAPAFWVLADAEGNEACVTTWQGRD